MKTTRRAFLGSAVVAATPSTALATSASAFEGVTSLAFCIERHAQMKASMRALWDFVDKASESEGVPEAGSLRMSEVGPYHRTLGRSKVLYWHNQIDEEVDLQIAASKQSIAQGITVEGHKRRIESLEVDRKKAHQMLSERDEAYRLWEVQSGVKAAEAEAERIGRTTGDIEQVIIAWAPSTLHEALIKNEWVIENWDWLGEEGREDAMRHLVSGRTKA